MELIKLTEKEYSNFASNHEQATFLQTISWAKLKQENNWDYVLLGCKVNKNILAATLLLSKATPLKKRMFYAPRGFLLDYENQSILKEFNDLIKKYVKENNGFFIKIDPYVMHIERDKNGQPIENGIDNSKIIQELKKMGYIEQCSKPGEQSLQAKWMYWINLKNKTMEQIEADMTSKTRQMIRKNQKNYVVTREGNYDDLVEFKKIMDHTGNRRQFISRPLSYYQNMYKAFGSGKTLKVIFADLCIYEKLKELKQDVFNAQKEYDKLIFDIEAGKKKISDQKLQLKKKGLESLKINVKKFEELYKKYGERLTIGAIFYFIHGKEVLSFIGGAYDEFMEFQPFYTIHYDMIKYAKENNYDYYNFYGISSDLTEKDPMYGVYQFKKGFGGEVVELIGEYDLKITNTYYLYKFAYSILKKLKKITVKIKSIVSKK